MKKHSSLKRILAVCLSLVMLLTLLPSTVWAAGLDGSSVNFERIDPSEVNINLRGGNFKDKYEKLDLDSAKDNTFKSTDRVRVMIVLPGAAAMSLMSEGVDASDPEVRAYREELQEYQEYAAEVISEEALGGEELDVVWNLTLAVNAISANVEYGQIEDIAKVGGVKAVYLERRYDPMTTTGGKAELNNIPAQGTTGAAALKLDGYTGAGMRIAVIDTGTAQYHQSFDEGAFEYSLRKQADAKKGSPVTDAEFETYKEGLNLLTEDEIDEVIEYLHASDAQGYEEGDAWILYGNSKLPFGYNYIDASTDISHITGYDDDGEEVFDEHGSHVAGIAAANSYIPNPDTSSEVKYVDAATTVGVTGVAPDAQIITMKVFGENGGAYSSDNFAAIEDAMTLGCDVVNLSLGSSGGFVTCKGEYRFVQGVPDDENDPTSIDSWINGIMDDITEHGIIMSVSAGNSGNWAEGDNYEAVYDVFYQIDPDLAAAAVSTTIGMGMMYTDEGGTYNVGSPSTFHNTMSVASAENVGSVSQSKTTFTDGTNEVNLGVYSTTSNNNPDWIVMDKNDGAGTEYDVVFLGDPTSGFAAGQLQMNTDPTIFGGYEKDEDGEITGLIGSNLGDALEGKIVMISRGTSSFFEKRDAAAELGAAAVICYNHTPGAGVVSADLTGSESEIPFGGLSYEDGEKIFDLCEKNDDGLYACTATVYGALYVDMGEAGAMPTMSDYSSWGTTGALTIKPEITAPGGGIYSVNGGEGSSEDTDQYENMSGTSMAAPHFSGLAALTKQYIQTQPTGGQSVLAKAKTAAGDSLTARQLVQSLLMSTADPLVEYEYEAEDGSTVQVPYSIRNQGAGLANVQKATSAKSFILMTPAAGKQQDGKVKAELGDGTSPWTFTFTIYNLTGEALTYDLSSKLMTTDTYADEDYDDLLFSTNWMVLLEDSTVAFSGGNRVTVAANGHTDVTATVTVGPQDKAYMESLGYDNGFYVEGFVYATPVDTTREGVLGVTHSIPMLGWYGSWTDISMFDGDSFLDQYGALLNGEEIRLPHVFNFYDLPFVRNILMVSAEGADPENPDEADLYTGNMYEDTQFGGLWGDEHYIPARNALNNTDEAWWQPTWFSPLLIRNAAAARVQIVDADGKKASDGTTLVNSCYYSEVYDEPFEGAYAHGSLGVLWDTSEYSYTAVGTKEDGSSPFAGISEGEDVILSFTYAPEYYEKYRTETDEDGEEQRVLDIDWDELGDGATMSFPFRIDNTAPTLNKASVRGSTLSVAATDSNYIAFIAVLDGSGTAFVDLPLCPDRDERGEMVLENFDISDLSGNKVIIELSDYAGNESFWKVNLSNGQYAGNGYGDLVAFQAGANFYGPYLKWVSFDANVNKNETDMFSSSSEFFCADYANGVVYAQDAQGWLYGIWYSDMVDGVMDFASSRLARLDNLYQDMAFNYQDGKLYGIRQDEDDICSYVDEINLTSYETTKTLTLDSVDALGLACDDDGTFYIMGLENGEGTAKLYKATGEAVAAQKANTYVALYDLNGDGVVSTFDAQSLLDDVIKGSHLVDAAKADLNHDGKLTTKDVNIFLDLNLQLVEKVLDTGKAMSYIQSMTWDHNTETLYWARYTESGTREVSELYVIDTEDGACIQTGTLSNETNAMFAPLTSTNAAKEEHSNVPSTPAGTIGTPVLTDEALTLAVGGTRQLSYDITPWYSQHKNVDWESSDTSVATVNPKGVVTAVAAGTSTITVKNHEDSSKTDTCTVTVVSPKLTIKGTYSEMGGNIGEVSDSYLYTYAMENGESTMTKGAQIYNPMAQWGGDSFGEQMVSTLMIPNVEMGMNILWTCESYNGMIQMVGTGTGEEDPTWAGKIDPFDFGAEPLGPIGGDVLYGMTYSADTDRVSGILNSWLYVDLPNFTNWLMDEPGVPDMDARWDEEGYPNLDWHRLELADELTAAGRNFSTGENGDGAITDIVLCGITDIGSAGTVTLTKDYLGGNTVSGTYTPNTTMVLLDNVGRLWYVDELTGMTKSGNTYTKSGSTVIGTTGIRTWKYAEDNYSVFVIREIVETPLTEMYWQGTMPRYTYHFSDIYYAGDGDNEVYLLSLYDYHNNGTTNELYLLTMDENGGTLIELGNTGRNNVIATIYDATVDLASLPSAPAAGASVGSDDEALPLAVGHYYAH